MLIEIKDEKLKKVLEERAVIFKEIGKVNEKLLELDKERTKLGYKMDKQKEKTKIFMDKLNPKLEEFEFISRVFMEKGKAYYEVLNMVEEYKRSLREEAKNKQHEAVTN